MQNFTNVLESSYLKTLLIDDSLEDNVNQRSLDNHLDEDRS